MNESMPPELPELPDETVRRIEENVFAEIARDRALDRASSSSDGPVAASRSTGRGRRRIWTGAASAAAVVLLAAVITPAVVSSLNGPGDGGGVATYESAPDVGSARDGAVLPSEDDSAMEAEAADTAEGQDSAEAGREVILTGSAVVVVDDTEEAAAAVVALAERHGGYVDGQQLSRDGADAAVREGGASVDTSYPAPYGQGSWVSLRVPADDIRAVLDELADIGELDSSQLTSDDVTTQAVDLRARVDATQISVDRLTDLMGQAGSLADLLAAEESLAARQAELESYQQQLTQLEDQVSMASLTVSLTTAAPPVVADPAGFGDGLAAGWDGLLATVNGVVIGLGFLLPWLGVLGVAAIVTWLLVRASRRRSARKDETENQP